ncbi:MAG: hypothetical protein A3C80_04435 [Candidatus Ryanbacteria bacterium RIFCSPHIGHO2_02_FULL_45_43]|uniref:Type II secretion system protein GspF domain-containing protein n=1 Tax=Candidatus Ryanbacteria bacterium RIFCSPHIGHO2_01_45_13 TaxID=1802112 RepID=A0A1G2G1E1_9BACT|nr:MAG: hypothetical protein A2718_04335 [Candidatus Ryanbacteria bacterium RIFCSPHIGHO2_01_FULL_44_130]OGZ43641.1 MAG: hypothetical protein A2W41_04830 [Candidatus Ryanbacteria bacterium RIFCSPHIGHO2_01_45_13]OGZ49123.1 MAG: hypothetical protein A3C80_04435 [Candidatus Ryanbacteria bacterium RIFCSPHIGHO2_02_FULL_45_43]OGZ51383.1 MAG: hypothetical protein A3A17_00135 [Candidatus Ryanbacteria bacterium RIFCSPLOWO2_01_FULL_44_230]OGZ53697.1 MAG: hypothetical protein A3H62_00885 [Candidatus Ryanba
MEFYYKVRSPEGELREGTTEAPSLSSAVRGLQKQNFVIVEITPTKEAHSFTAMFKTFVARVSPRDVVLLSRQLATLFDAKVPVVQALRTLASEMQKPVLKQELKELLDDIQGGMSISQAMERHPQIFSPFYVNMVRSGEESGKLSEVFMYLADYLERSYELRTKVRNALIYPAFVLVAFVGVMILLLTVIIPNIAQIFEEANVALPFYTRIVIAVSLFAKNYWLFIILVLALMAAFVWRYVQTPAGRSAWSRFSISVLIVGPLYKKMYLARFADNFQTLLSAGVPVIRSLQITANIIGNTVYRDIVLQSLEAVKGGSSVAEALSKYKDMPPLVTQMIRIGEETGKLDSMLKSLAHFYTAEVNNLVDNFVALIEPVLIIVLGAGVGFLVAAVLLPLYSITAAI